MALRLSIDAEQQIEVEDVVRNLVQEVMRECSKQKLRVFEDFVRYYVHLLILNPVWKVMTSERIDRAQIQNLVKHCVTHISNSLWEPSMITLKMQLYFNANFNTQEEMIAQNRTNLKARLAPLQREIMDSQLNQYEDEHMADLYSHKLYRKIVVYITLCSGLGNPNLVGVFLEAKLALQSIFPLEEVKEFTLLSITEKEEQLEELKNLVMGIRLFNRDRNRGGEGIEDLPGLLMSSIGAFKNNLQSVLLNVMETVNMLTTAIENCYVTKKNKHEECKLILTIPKELQESDVEYAKEFLIMNRQMEIYVRKLMDEVDKIETRCSNIILLLQDVFVTLNGVVSFRCAIPTNRVFPIFLDISSLWTQLQDYTILTSKLNQMLYQLNEYVKLMDSPTELYRLMIGPEGPLTDAERLERTSHFEINEDELAMKVFHSTSITSSDSLQLQFLGFCPWRLVNTKGALLPGNPHMGICMANDKFYVFGSVEGARIFGKDPDTYTNAVLETIRKKPELINLLQVYDILNSIRHVDPLYIPPKERIESDDVEVQTELHPVQSFIDPNYKWNIWDWKRQALTLATISRLKTKTTQTNLSNARNEIRIQTWPPKDQICQTKIDNYTNVPTLSNFIFGLRGRKDDLQHIITLTRPVDEFLRCEPEEKKCAEKKKADNM